MTAETARPAPRRGLHARDLGAALLAVVGASIGLLITSWLVPNVHIGGPAQLLLSGLLVSVCGLVLRIILVPVTARLGWVSTILLGLLGQTVAIWLVLFSHSSTPADWAWSLLAAWIVAAVSTLLIWLATAGTDEAVTASLLRLARLRRTTVADPEVPGVVFIQFDGVPYPVLQWCLRAGTLPNLSRWVRDGSHHMTEWRPMLPATTPASQMGILHGTIDGIPAFRWLDRTDGKIYVANKPRDAAVIERTHSNGRGLLVDDGVSISNLFTGDAPIAVATMSAVDRSRESRQARLAISEFLGRPTGFARAAVRGISEIVRERFQAAKARRRDIRPRVHRGWSFAFERAALIGVIRDLNTTLVADAMLRGRRSIYVDYVDYDGVAHHAGLLQPESLDALAGMDAVLAQIERVAAVAPRPYHVVILSDHGQSQGATFADRYGEDLAALVARLADAPAVASVENQEGKGSLNSMVASAGDQDSAMGRALDRVSGRLAERTTADIDVAEDQASPPEALADKSATEEAGRFVVFGSGNLGLVYVSGEPSRVFLEDLDARFPALVRGLVAHPGVGFVVAHSMQDGIVVLGANGEHRLSDGRVTGIDPLGPFGPMAPAFVRRAAEMPEAPDLYVNSLVDDLDEVAAFEGLVGCHGGLGGWQDRAMLVYPTALRQPTDMVVGAHELHRVLVGWLEDLGHRQELDETVGRERDLAAGADITGNG
jgi:hypothetical protein